MPAQPLARLDPSTRDAALNAAAPKVSAAKPVIVGFIGVQLVGPSTRPTLRAFDGRHGLQQGHKNGAVLAISGRDFYRERDALALDHNMALRARFAAIRRIRAGGLTPLFAG